MQEILRDLIQSYSENGNPKKQKEFKFYSNLSITQPIQKHTDLSKSISNGIDFLEKIFDPKTCFQSWPSNSSTRQSEKTFKEEEQFPSSDCEFPLEIYTSILALDLLGDDEGFEIKISDSILKALKNFILPESGLSTFNIFKNPHSKFLLEESSEEEANEFCFSSLSASDDEDISTSTSSSSNSSSDKSLTSKVVADDCNTTALAIALLLREGILDIKPTASITEVLLSNNNSKVLFQSCSTNNLDDGNINTIKKSFKTHQEYAEGVIHTFLDGEGLDPVSCANVLYLYYLTDMTLNYEENVESTEIFLLQTLKNLTIGTSTNTSAEEQDSESKFMLHHSVDALLFFLSRSTLISAHASARFSEPLIALLDKRIGQTSYPLDLAMRILSADALGLLTNEDGNWIRRKIEEDYETLVSLQNQADGSWPADSLFRIFTTSDSDADDTNRDEIVYFGGRELSTIFACKALDVYYESMKTVKIQTRLYKDYVY